MLSRFSNADSAVGLADALGFYMDAGGFVMPPLILATVVLWFALGARWALLRRGSKKNVRVLLKKYADGRAKAPDGIVEAVEDPSMPLWLGVQWHPERMHDQPEYLALFKLLVERAAEKPTR